LFFIEAATSSMTPAREAQKTLQRQRLDALDHDAADHLDGGGGAGFGPGNADAHAERSEHWRDRARMRAGKQHRRLMPRRINRRQHRDVDIAAGIAEELCGVLLAAGRYRVDVEKVRRDGKMRLDCLRRFDARGRGDRRDNEVHTADRVRGRIGATHSRRLGGLLEFFARCLGKQNVPGRHRPHAGLAQSGGYGLACFAKADECDCWLAV
jgi:hypothetical protein